MLITGRDPGHGLKALERLRRAASYLLFDVDPLGSPSLSLAAPDIVVGSNERRTYDCRGGSATVEGGFNVLTLRNCTEIIVNGGDNTIDAGVVDAIEVAGADNGITWTESADGRRPRITNEGQGNVSTSHRSSGQTAPAAGKIRVDQDGQREEYDCRDANAGAVRGVQSVLINGNDNKLTWELAEDGSRPRITDNGRGNTVTGKR